MTTLYKQQRLDNHSSFIENSRPGTIIRFVLFSSMLKSLIKPNDLVLDIGGFDGTIASLIKQETKSEVIVLDIDKSGLSRAEEKNLRTMNASATDIPMDDASIDVVLSFDNIEHIIDDKKVFHEISRILKPNGLLFLTTTDNDFSLPFFSKTYIARKWNHVRVGYKLSELESNLDCVGLNILKKGKFNTFLTRLIYMILYFLPLFRKMAGRNGIFISVLKLENKCSFGAQEHWIIAQKREPLM